MANASKRPATPDPYAQPFKVFALEASSAPDDGTPGTWYRYTIGEGENVITGWRRGTEAAVTKAVEKIVEGLNERRVGYRGLAHLTAPRGRPKRSTTR